MVLLSWRILNLFFCILLLLTSLLRWKLDTCFSAWNSMFRDHYGVKCNRYGHVAGQCRGKHSLLLKCPNCGGGHSANDKICSRCKRETEILKLSYNGCKIHRIARSPPVMVSQSAFPPLPKKTWVDRTRARSIVGAAPFPHAAGVPPDQDDHFWTTWFFQPLV